eukprot:6911-Heterococcus_DN1.PRE.9
MQLTPALSRPEDLHILNIPQILSDGVCLVEWPERLGHFTPRQRLEIHITATNETMRDVTVIGYGDWWRDAIACAAQAMQKTADASAIESFEPRCTHTRSMHPYICARVFRHHSLLQQLTVNAGSSKVVPLTEAGEHYVTCKVLLVCVMANVYHIDQPCTDRSTFLVRKRTRMSLKRKIAAPSAYCG